jgi:hypothetical protein
MPNLTKLKIDRVQARLGNCSGGGQKVRDLLRQRNLTLSQMPAKSGANIILRACYNTILRMKKIDLHIHTIPIDNKDA